MRVVYSDLYRVPPAASPEFRTEKFGEAARGLIAATGEAVEFVTPPMPSREALGRVHDPEYVERVLACRELPGEFEALGLRLTKPLVGAHRMHCGGTLAACRLALEDGVGLHAGGGAHHAHRARGGGFCLFNDIAFAALELQREATVERVLVVDLDAHQGDGTATLLAAAPGAFTFSIHQEDIYPEEKAAGDLDVALPAKAGAARYFEALSTHLPRATATADPELAIYVAGADPYEKDLKADLGLSREDLRRRDAEVLTFLRGKGVPTAVVLGGGYAADPADTVAIHVATLVEAANALKVRTHG